MAKLTDICRCGHRRAKHSARSLHCMNCKKNDFGEMRWCRCLQYDATYASPLIDAAEPYKELCLMANSVIDLTIGDKPA